MGAMSGSAVGIFAISSKFATTMDMIYGFFYQSWKESSARILNDDDKDEFYNLVYKYLKSFMYSIVLLITAFIPLIFYVLIDKSYNEAILYVPILLIATYFSNISGFYGGIFTAYKDTKIMGTTTIVAAVVNLILMISSINLAGLYAVSLAALIANLVVYQYRKVKVRKYVRLKENKWKMAIDCIVTGVVLALFYSMQIYLQVIGIIIAILYSIGMNCALLHKVYLKIKHK